MSLHHEPTPPCQDVKRQEHLQCPRSSSAIRSSASFQPQLRRSSFLSKSKKCHYMTATGETLMRVAVFFHPLLMLCYNQAAKAPHGGAAVGFRGDWWPRNGLLSHQNHRLSDVNCLSGQWTTGFRAAQWAHVLFLAAPTGELSLMHPKPPPDKHTASQKKTETHPLLFSSVFTVYFCWADWHLNKPQENYT